MALFAQTGLKDVQTNKQVWVDEFNAIRANPTFLIAGVPFSGSTKDPNFWAETDSGSGSVSQSNGILTLETGATPNSTAQYQSVRVGRWVPGQENDFRTVLKCDDTGAANNIRNWGAFNSTDGFFFQLNNTALNIVWRKASVDTVIAQGSWNGNAHGLTNSFTMDTNFHIWEIRMTQADIHFYIDHNIMHTLIPVATEFTTTLSLPVTLQNNNSGGGTSDVKMETPVAFIARIGHNHTENHYRNITSATTTILKYGSGKIHRIIFGTQVTQDITIYDNTAASGTQIGILHTTSGGSPLPFYIEFDAPFYNGLTIVTSGAGNITVVYE